jgi:DNA-binding winged helix-turn-helix (wHTH) protein/tetratricopeptide (TPR) repeat protein
VQRGTTYEFSEFRLIPEDSLLLRNGEPVSLPPKAFETLVLLIQRSGHLVRKAEVIEAVWPNVFVEEAVVSKSVWMIRNALGEDSKNQHFIQTVPKRGYKFVGDVKEFRETDVVYAQRNVSGNEHAVAGDAVTDDGLEQPDPDVGAARRVPRERSGAYLAFAVVVLAVVGFGALYVASVGTTTTRGVTRIAVLPLTPIDPASRSVVYEIGVADSLINRINSIDGLVARPLSATRRYDGIERDPVEAGREQKVDQVIAANYQVAEGKFRLTGQLINVENGQVEETFKVETDGESVFGIQDAVADEIARRLIARSRVTKLGQVARRGTDNEEAYRLYLQGKNLAMMRHPTYAKKAVEFLDRAIQLDPNFAPAYAQMARVYHESDPSDPSVYEKRMAFINSALELDRDLADAYVARAEIYLLRDWNFSAVEKDLSRALELEPNNDQAHWLSAMSLVNRGYVDQALSKIETARAIDPTAVMYMVHRGRILYYARRYDEAVTQYQEAIDMDDRIVQPHGWMARVYELKGDYGTAYRYLIDKEARSPRKDQIDVYRRLYEAEGLVGLKRRLAETTSIGLFDLAAFYALQNEKEAAFEYLNKSFEKREWTMMTMKVEPALDNLRGDPRFAELERRVFSQ